MKKYVILISGRGSNMRALIEARLPGQCAAVIADRPEAAGLIWAQKQGILTQVVNYRAFATRAEFEARLASTLTALQPDLLLLAGFMRILSAEFVSHFAGKMLNIHPSLLPEFSGLNTHRRALAAGVKAHGCTVHVVTAALDGGPIVAQAHVPVLPDDNEDTLATRVLIEEHRIYPQAARWFLEGRVAVTSSGDVAQASAC